MKVPLSWLRDYVDFSWNAGELADKLTFAGIEVEAIDQHGVLPKDIIAAEITSVEPHIHANHLFVCLVNNGTEVLRVVSGARNCRVGDRVPLAAAGATLPGGTVVKAEKIRGESSQGILCAEDELGLSDDHSGLMVLPRDTPLGKSLCDVLGPPDSVLTLEITPNRPDLLGLIGIAREVAALSGAKLKLPAPNPANAAQGAQPDFSVVVEDASACPRYVARALAGAKVAPSPFWLRRRLAMAGVRAVNNIVDITNYVLLECGQPLHAFDLHQLAGRKIIVRRAKKGENIVALDMLEYKLDERMLVIADAERPVAIAGVMGAASSGIQPGTSSILLESACFKPALIRYTSRALGLASESSYRFERGVDPNQADFASRRACAMIAELAGASVSGAAIDVYPQPAADRRITCRYGRVSSLLGAEVPPERIRTILNALDLPAGGDQPDACTVTVKSFRPDLETEADLIEEVARIHGLDKIPVYDPRCRVVADADDRPIRSQWRCRDLLASLGLQEIVNYSFVSPRLMNLFDASEAARRVVLPRPVSAEHTLLRDSLLPQMAETLGRNKSRQVDEAALFEMSRVFRAGEHGGFHEETRIAIGIMGPAQRSMLNKRKNLGEAEMFSWLKGILFNFYAKLLPGVEIQGAGASDSGKGLALCERAGAIKAPGGLYAGCFKPNRSALIMLDGAPCGIMGLLKPEIGREWRILDPVGLMEFNPAPFLKRATQTVLVNPLPVYPSVTRDIALRAPVAMRHADILKTIWKNAPKELTSAVLFDIYASKDIGVGYKSMAYSLTYRSPDRTLTDEEVNQLHEAVRAKLRNELKVEIREG